MQLEAAQDAIDQKVGEFRNFGLLQRSGQFGSFNAASRSDSVPTPWCLI